jgi:hypothetical protein
MNKDNLIIIKGGSYNDIKKALRQWIEIYSEDVETDIKFELYKTELESYIIIVDKRLNNEKFNFLVNYLYFPEGIEYKVNIEGFTTALDRKLYPKDILNKKILVYIPDNNTEYDNVYVATNDNEVYKIDFDNKVTKINETRVYLFPEIDFESLSKPEKITLSKTEIAEKKEEKSKRKLKRKFLIYSFIIIGLIIISSMTLFIVNDIFIKTTFFLGLGIAFWFFDDYRMLQIDKYYNYCLLIAVAFLSYVYLMKYLFHSIDMELNDFTAFSPLSILLVQRPLRLIFKKIFKREPIVINPAPTFWDGIYIFILLASFIALPEIFVYKLK